MSTQLSSELGCWLVTCLLMIVSTNNYRFYKYSYRFRNTHPVPHDTFPPLATQKVDTMLSTMEGGEITGEEKGLSQPVYGKKKRERDFGVDWLLTKLGGHF